MRKYVIINLHGKYKVVSNKKYKKSSLLKHYGYVAKGTRKELKKKGWCFQ